MSEQELRGGAAGEPFDEGEEDCLADRYLSFRLGGESYGIGIGFVTEIVELQRISAVPGMPPFMKGVVNLRGTVIPAMDLRLRFGMEERAYDDRTCIVVASVRGRSIGFVVDTVEEVTEIPPADIEDASRFRASAREGACVAGIGKVGDRIKLLLDVDRVVGDEAFAAPGSRAGGNNA
jgi:purine-binding chemotaxis protein CheW